jgi:type IV pilus assembly protein PilC
MESPAPTRYNVFIMTDRNRLFIWSGFTFEGEAITGEIYAANRHIAQHELLTKQIIPHSITKKLTLFTKNPAKLAIATFLNQLSTLITCGLSISQACDILSEDNKSSVLNSVIKHVKQKIQNGESLSSALKSHAHLFDSLTLHLIFIGEETGTLGQALKRIAAQQEKLIRLKKNIVQSLFYPTILLVITLIVATFMMLFIIPTFADLFANAHAKLPLFTQYVITASALIKLYFMDILIFISLMIGMFIGSYHQFARVKQLVDAMSFNIPNIGMFYKKCLLTRLARTLTICLSSGIPLLQSLKLCLSLTNHSGLLNIIHNLIRTIQSGKSFYQSMVDIKDIPNDFKQMVKIGEETGMLDEMLAKLADFYEFDVDHTLSHLSKLLEPLIIVILGVLIGGLVIAMYLPIFKLGTVI